MTAMDIVGADMWTAHGHGRRHVFDALLDGELAVAPLVHLDAARYRCQHAYEIAAAGDCRNTAWLRAVVAGALAEALVDVSGERVAVLVGTGLREQPTLEQWQQGKAQFSLSDWDYRQAIQEQLGAPVAVYTIVNACAASLCCLTLARDMLELDQVDVVVVAGTDSISSSMYGLLDRANSVPPDVIQPFDQQRKGVLMGEGAAAIVLRASASNSSAPVLGTLRAVVQSCDARNETAPDLQGVETSMRLAHSAANLTADQIDLVMAHATGTQLNDDTEAAALASVFGAAAGQVMLAGVKAMTGHTAGASGLINLITGLEIFRSGCVPPAPGLNQPIAAAARFNTAGGAHGALDRIQINAFGFGGVNAVCILERAHA